MSTIRISIIEDQQLFRNGVSALLKEVEDLDILSTVENGKLFVDSLPSMQNLPDVILADLNMPEMNGLELASYMQQHYPSIKIIVLTVYNQERFISKMTEAGVAGYLFKNCDIEEVILAIRTAHKSGFYFNENVLKALRAGNKARSGKISNLSHIPVDLTERETEVLKLICMEYTNAEIAKKLYLSARTVDGHRNNLLAKTGCKNTAGLVLFAVNNKIFDAVTF